jgi:hypothetical protein
MPFGSHRLEEAGGRGEVGSVGVILHRLVMILDGARPWELSCDLVTRRASLDRRWGRWDRIGLGAAPAGQVDPCLGPGRHPGIGCAGPSLRVIPVDWIEMFEVERRIDE